MKTKTTFKILKNSSYLFKVKVFSIFLLFFVVGCRETLLPLNPSFAPPPSQGFDDPNMAPIDSEPEEERSAREIRWMEAHQDLQAIFNELVAVGDGFTQFHYQALVKNHASFSPELRNRLDNYFAFTDKVSIQRLLGPSENPETRRFKKAFWMNFYNACTVNIVTQNFDRISSNPEGINSLGIWGAPLCSVGGGVLSLDQIEHGILRNAEARGLIRRNDSKALPESLKADHDFFDYRVHFAVNCASGSCPQLSPELFTSLNIETLLAQLEKSFWVDGKEAVPPHKQQVRISRREVSINPIIESWYRVDFPSDLASYLRNFIDFPAN